jgi:hypothetical protein
MLMSVVLPAPLGPEQPEEFAQHLFKLAAGYQ